MHGRAHNEAPWSAIKTTIVYFVLSVVWIVATDKLVALYIKNPEVNLSLQTYKGWFFVVVTSVFIYFFLHRLELNQEALKVSEEKFSKVFIYAPEINVVSTLDRGIFVDVNEAFEREIGYSRAEVVGKSAVDLGIWNNPNDRKKMVEEIAKKRIIRDREYLFRRKNGEIITCLCSIAIVTMENKDYILLLAVNIEDRKKTERELERMINMIKNEKKRFQTVILEMGDAVLVTDKNNKVILANKTAAGMCSVKESALLGKNIEEALDLRYASSGERPEDFMEKVLRNEGTQRPKEQVIMVGKNGKKIVVDLVVTTIIDEDISGTVWILRDITKEKELEKMRIDFVSLTSHQLRTPLTGIKWFVDLLGQGIGKLSKDQIQEYVQRIGEGSDRMVNLVNALLTTSKIDNGETMPEFKINGLRGLLEKALENQWKLNESKKIKVSGLDKVNEKLKVEGDEVQLIHIFDSVINNAITYSPEKSEVEIGVKKNKDRVVVSIEDHGMGIPASQQGKIFEKFFRGDNVSKTVPGSGLGLYIAKNMVDNHNGKIWVQSKENIGSTFFVELPIKQKNE